VINRDPANIMERGQAGDVEKEGTTSGPSEIVVLEEDEKMERGPSADGDSADADALTVAVTEPEEAKPDNAPDGTEVYAEWKEGPHRIIERRTGPGEEVSIFLHICVRPRADIVLTNGMFRSRLRFNVTHMARVRRSALLAYFAAVMPQCTMLQTHSSAV
jgi:hypothetical protein